MITSTIMKKSIYLYKNCESIKNTMKKKNKASSLTANRVSLKENIDK